MQTVLHLERMFLKKTETFIYNQINSISNYNVDIGCIERLNRGEAFANVISPPKKDLYFRTKIIRCSDKKYLLNTFCNNNYSLIHSHFISDAAFFHPITNHMKQPKVVSAYGYDVSEFPNRYYGIGKSYLNKTFQNYDLVLAMSQDMKNDLLNIGCPDYKILIHYHGIDTSFFLNPKRSYIEPETFNLLSVGTICEKKGQHLVIDALNILINKKGIKNIKYNIVGSGPYESLVQKKIAQYNLSNYVEILGHISYGNNLVEQYNKADIFIHPCITDSRNSKEGIPGVIVEAMSNGLPVITTKHAGIPSVISNYQNGMLLDEKNIEQIVESIQQLLHSQKLRQLLGCTAAEYAVNNLDVHKKTKYLEQEIYAKLIW